MTSSTAALLRPLPKVLLHDHLDGGLRPATVVDLCAEAGHALPTTDPDDLAAWFVAAASSGSLERYLETFAHTVAAMQTPEALRRVAREAVEDLAADGVVLAEVRYAPELHVQRGLTLDEVVAAVNAGFDEGVRAAAAAGRAIRVGALLCAMRQTRRSAEVAALAVAHRVGTGSGRDGGTGGGAGGGTGGGTGVVGLDLAGPEDGFPATDHAEAFALARSALLPVTVHAGEAAGVPSVRGALQVGALRLGHGIHVADDVTPDGRLGEVAHWVRDRGTVLETCPSSNLQTGGATSAATHPATRLRDLGFAVTVNTDNRLQSGTSLTAEMALLVDEAGWTLADLRDATVRAARASFLHDDERTRLVDTVIAPAWAAVLDPTREDVP